MFAAVHCVVWIVIDDSLVYGLFSLAELIFVSSVPSFM